MIVRLLRCKSVRIVLAAFSFKIRFKQHKCNGKRTANGFSSIRNQDERRYIFGVNVHKQKLEERRKKKSLLVKKSKTSNTRLVLTHRSHKETKKSAEKSNRSICFSWKRSIGYCGFARSSNVYFRCFAKPTIQPKTKFIQKLANHICISRVFASTEQLQTNSLWKEKGKTSEKHSVSHAIVLLK